MPRDRITWLNATPYGTQLKSSKVTFCVQEMHLLPSSTALCSNNKYPHIYHATFHSKKRGVLISIRNDVDFHLLQAILDPNGRYIILICIMNKITYTMLNVYAPNTHQMSFLGKALCKAPKLCKGHLLICGDFNLVVDIHMDTTSAAKGRESPLKHFFAANDLYDVWRCHHGSEKDFTYFSLHHKSNLRINIFLTDKWLLQKISTSVIHTMTWSDHAPITVFYQRHWAPEECIPLAGQQLYSATPKILPGN